VTAPGDGPATGSLQAVVRYLSDDWLAEAAEAVAPLTPLPVSLAVGYLVTGAPGGDRRYRLVLGPDQVSFDRGEEADLVFVQSFDTARDVARGERSAQRAFLDGDLRVEGDLRVLLGHQRSLAAAEDRLGPLRARTAFD
jgi:hypothetical protein